MSGTQPPSAMPNGTPPELLALLKRAVQAPPMSPTERRRQREGWVIAEIGMGSDVDEAAYAAAYADGDLAEIKRLDAEAQERMRRAQAYFAAMSAAP